MPEYSDNYREDQAAIMNNKRAKERDIGEIPEVVDPKRRAFAEQSPENFARTYFPAVLYNELTESHCDDFASIQYIVDYGGKKVKAAPRGDGKTTRIQIGAMWAAFTGRKKFIATIGSDKDAADDVIEWISTEVETNDDLADDFPEICYPVRCLEGIPRRAPAQTCEGVRTLMEWTTSQLVFPTVKGSKASGVIVRSYGMTARIRGAKVGNTRPDFVIIDDPQTKEPLALNTPIPTPSGFVPLSDIHAGSIVFDANGNETIVVGESDVKYGRDCYEITFDDGHKIVADGDHLWTVQTALQRTNQRRRRSNSKRVPHNIKPLHTTLKTSDMISDLLAEGGRNNYSIDIAPLVSFSGKINGEIEPYVLGAWLGDGDTNQGRITGFEEIFYEIEKYGYESGSRNYKEGSLAYSTTIYGLRGKLRRMGLLGNKHIPNEYLYSDEESRLELLRGLMDTDGCVSSGDKGVKGTRFIFANTNRNIIDGVHFLCKSLGIKSSINNVSKKADRHKESWLVTFVTNRRVFSLKRKIDKIPDTVKKSVRRRYIKNIERVDSVPVKCITVDNEDHLFLAGDGMIATHNSAKSWTQVVDREKTINQDIKGLAGQGKEIAIFILCTVIEEGDLASRMLNAKLHPDWEQSVVSLIEAWPTNMELWEKEYHEVWVKGIEAKDRQESANKFYQDNIEELEDGCVLSNPFRKTKNDASAIQHAMHLYFEDRSGFFSEYQNRPLRDEGNIYDLKPEMVQNRLNGYAKNQIPDGHNFVIACADVNYIGLNTVVSAFSNDFTGCAIDYFKYPEGMQVLYDSNKSNKTTQAQAISLGISHLIKLLIEKSYGEKIDALIIDANFMTETVVKSIRRCLRQINPPFIVLPFRGRSFRQYRVKKSTLVGRPGQYCHMEKNGLRGKQFIQDSDYWRMTAQQAFLLDPSQPGSYSFWGKNDKRHADIAAEICAEKLSNYSADTGQGPMYKWTFQVGALNDKLDALVGSYSMANLMGAELTGGETAWRKKKKTRQAQEKAKSQPEAREQKIVREQRQRKPTKRRRYR